MGILSLFFPAPKDRPGVYCITNRSTGWFYIGATTLAITERWNRHIYMLDTGRHHNKRLQADWDEYGGQAFKFSVVEVVQDTSQVFIREQYWQRRKYTGKCYNPHPDDIPDFIKKRIASRQRTVDYRSSEVQDAIVTLFRWLPGSEDKMESLLRKQGTPEDVLTFCRDTAISLGPLSSKRRR